jgi:hypothetical protein
MHQFTVSLTQISAEMNRAFSAGGFHEFLGRCPRLLMNAAPLALNTYAGSVGVSV